MSVQVMIVEDQHLLREGLKMMLQSDGAMIVVTEASSAEEALEKVESSPCQVILMDISLPGKDGVWCTRSLRERGCETPVLMVTTHETDSHVREALGAGANGYVLKSASPQELRRAVDAVLQGGSYVQPTLLGNVVREIREPKLSLLETEVLEMHTKGVGLDEIQSRLSLSKASLQSHLRSLMRKLEGMPTVVVESPPSREIEVGAQVGSYVIRRLLGKGGMALVYEAEHETLERKAAVKVISLSLSADPRANLRFQNEAKAAARIDHPNVVGIYDILVWGGRSCIAMQLVEGGSVQDLLGHGPLAVDEATRVMVAACRGLQAAHERQVLHRDLKPANILLGADGAVRLTDFGLAKLCEASEGITMAGTILGTPEYMSPEQCRGQQPDIRTDIYQLGATFYALLTGKPPFAHHSQFWEVMRAQCHEEPPPLPGPHGAIALRALAKEPEDRYADVDEMLRELLKL